MNRRRFLVGGAAAAVALKAAPALAADEGTLLLGLWRREIGLAMAYGQQVHTRPELFGPARRHANDHAAALATELAAVGLGTPEPPWTPDELDVSAQRLATARPADVMANAVLAQESMLTLYQGALPSLPDAKIAMTAATILASHAQHLFILRRAA
ncbi:ferritin-like domain-containing protein [Solirubrobacter sp. CPCC 204708]|uniref:Ferritin-like domain-containing protein n=1 Tax=Solirubrobacter deserti TaxID=2282478 RepID=A0ABT4RUI6_9ACTN|nr:ferritin-like domain-containing protein [Solirubrobacter deserti]MBE2320187.1 ferritin-like domain-containing protein [Solirubrobacter deserti]MDA0142234.1 ferritin-like domain-containing protein [Solirubrobacter deserti]